MKLAYLRPKAARSKIHFDKKLPDFLAGALHVGLFVLGGMMLAHWFWLIFSPHTQVLLPKAEQPISSQALTILASHWFGTFGGQVVAAPVNVNFKLMGVYVSGGNKQGFAIFKLADGKQRAVLPHQQIIPDISLKSIEPGLVKIEQNGSVQTMQLESKVLNNKVPALSLPAITK